ncbi:MAG: radical SAM protein [Clostridia bacterium]|nr:radical SAM protein [Clostridia bacterium]
MRVISTGKKDILRILAMTSTHGSQYTQSLYVLRRETENGVLLCNTLTGELVLLSPEEKEAFDRLPGSPASVLAELMGHRFVVPRDCDEGRAAEQLRALMLKRREAKGIITHYNILPTTYCNARCFYCFESGIRQTHMSQETADKLVAFIAAHHGNKMVKLSWFGGEPLLGRQMNDRICRELGRLDIPYVSDMTSNGYLFDDDLVRQAREVWKLERIQVTLDGTREIYNRIKAYVSPGEDPYLRVLRNIGLLTEAGVHVDIRLNMDIHNTEDLARLIDELAERFTERERLFVYVRQLNEGDGFDPIRHSREELEQLKQQLIELQERLELKGWPQYKDSRLPCLRTNTCMADDPQCIQCTPDGIFSKCEDKIYEHTVGTVESGITDREQVRWWQQRVSYPGCAECPLYPSCIRLLKNCPVKREKCTDYDLEHRIACYLDLMLEKYEVWKRGECHDGESSLPDEGGRPDC